jgi:hypothetical protein
VGRYGVGCWTIIRDAGGDGFATIRTAVSWLGWAGLCRCEVCGVGLLELTRVLSAAGVWY